MLEIKNLFVQYKNAKHPAVKDVSFSVKRGDCLAILGPSGCGKSTTLNVIARLITEKEAEIKGEIMWGMADKKPIVRMVFQTPTLLPWRTVASNVALGLEAMNFSPEHIREKVSAMLHMVGLSENAKMHPSQLSVGMNQRVNFARALACDPDLLLLDEPFSALDMETKKDIQAEFSRIIKEKGITSILVTHDMEEAITMASKIIILSGYPSKVNHSIDMSTDDLSILKDRQKIIKNMEIYE